jgi:hypothetical protein
VSKIVIVYYAFLKPGGRWAAIVDGQLSQLRETGVVDVADVHVRVTGAGPDLSRAARLIASVVPRAEIHASDWNRFEYPGIHGTWTLARQQPEALYLYFHSKGVSGNVAGRTREERRLFQEVIVPWRSIVDVFDRHAQIDKVGFAASAEGWLWFNFWWARGSYLAGCQEPVVSGDRWYYETWLHRRRDGISGPDDCYSLAANRAGVSYTAPEASAQLETIVLRLPPVARRPYPRAVADDRVDPTRLLGDDDPPRDDLLLSALAPPAIALAAWRRWVAWQTDPANDPVAARWLPLVGWHLDHSALNERSRRWLDDARRGTWVANMRAWTAAEPALDRLESEGIEYVVLKGAALAWTVYDSIMLRPFGDLDVLVRPEAATRASTLLEADGWESAHRVPSSDLESLHAINYTQAPDGALDLHRYALRECCWSDVDAGFWRRSVTATVGGRRARVLSPADQLLHVCVHGLRWNPVHSSHWVADATRIIAQVGASIDWPTLVEEARRRDLVFQVHEALRFVRRVTRAPVPDAALSALATGRVSWRDRIECHVKTRPLHGPGGLLLMWYDWRRLRTRPSPIGFARYLAHSMRLASPWQLFPRSLQILRSRC